MIWLTSLDDFLLGRAHQPIVDLVAEFGAKKHNLASVCAGLSGVLIFLHDGLRPANIIFCVLWLVIAWVYSTGLVATSYFPVRILFVGLFMAGIPALDLFSVALVLQTSAHYFISCRDKPPRRRRWQELKQTIETRSPDPVGSKSSSEIAVATSRDGTTDAAVWATVAPLSFV